MILAFFLGAMGMSLLCQMDLPAEIAGIPSSFWAPGGSTVILPNGSRMEYLTWRESRDAFSPMETQVSIDYSVPASQINFDFDRDIWYDTEAAPPSLFHVKILGGRDFTLIPVVRPEEEKSYSAIPQGRSIVYARIEEVYFDPSSRPRKAGEIISIAWKGYYSSGSFTHSGSGYALYPGQEYFLLLRDHENLWQSDLPASALEDEKAWVRSHAQYVFCDFSLNSRGFWPIADGKIYTPPGVAPNLPGAGLNMWGVPTAKYSLETFTPALRAFFDEVREKRGEEEPRT